MTDPRIPDRCDCVLRNLIDRYADEIPDAIFAVFEDGSEWRYDELARRVRAAANGLISVGVRQGDNVLAWLPNGPDVLLTWFATNYIGAVYVPLNIAYKGNLLAHVIALSDASVCVMHAGLVDQLEEVDLARLRKIIVVGGEAGAVTGLEVYGSDLLSSGNETVATLERDIEPWDTQSIIFTSGTTGPSKGVMSSYAHLHAMGVAMPDARSDDRQLVTLPMFHAGGTGSVYRMLSVGGSIAMTGPFQTGSFWQIAKQTGTTTIVLAGVMANFLTVQPDDGAHRGHRIRNATIIPMDAAAVEFGRRFGITVYTMFNMTETSGPIVSEPSPTALGSCGRARPGVELRIVDENDCEVETGQPGELIIRTDAPWAMTHGYYKNAEATAASWRNGWFHTGDRFRMDADGLFYFVDRVKDAIRRRGENISSFEIEAEICAHGAVREAAAVAVRSELAEDELLAVIALQEGAEFDPADLIAFLRPRVAHFMIPRYVRIVADLPKTPTMKVQKHILRDEGLADDVWDRVRANVEVKREVL